MGTHKKRFSEVKDKIVSLSKEGCSYEAIKKRLKVSTRLVARALREDGAIPSNLSPEVEEKIAELYKDGRNYREIKKQLRIDGGWITDTLKKRNIAARCLGNGGANRRITYDEEYFHDINTPEKAYWFGFWCADGCVAAKRTKKGKKRGYECFMNLSMKDETHLLQFAKDIKYPADKIIYKNKKGRRCERKVAAFVSIYCSSKKMFDALTAHGCVQRKTWLLTFPTFLSDKLMPHFIRGYFDGDGSISLRKGKTNEKGGSVTILGNQVFTRTLKAHLIAQGLHVYIYPQKGCYAVSIHRIRDIEKFYALYYARATRYLERKRKKFDLLFERNKDTRYRKG